MTASQIVLAAGCALFLVQLVAGFTLMIYGAPRPPEWLFAMLYTSIALSAGGGAVMAVDWFRGRFCK